MPRRQKQPKTAEPTLEAPPLPAAKLPDPPPLPANYQGVALFPLQAYDVDTDLLLALENALLGEIDEVPGMQAVSPQDVKGALSEVHLNIETCDRDLACLAQAGRYARAQLALETRVSSLGGTLTMALRLIDTVQSHEIARAAEPLSDDEKERLQLMHRLAVQLLDPNGYVGALAVQCPTAGAEVYLDDKMLGSTPLPALENLPAGLHVLRLSKPGFSDINRFVDVVLNRSATVQVDFTDTTVAGVFVEQVSATGFGEIYLITQDPGLEVRIDGEPVGVTPLNGSITKVAAGRRRITLRKPGQPAIVQEIDIKANIRTDAVLRSGAEGVKMEGRRDVPPGTPLPTMESLLHPPAPPTPSTFVASRPSWRLYAGIGGCVAGGASFVAASLYAHNVKMFGDEAQAIATDAQAATWSLDVRAVKAARLVALNKQGPNAQLKEFVWGGAGVMFAATGVGFILWDVLRHDPPPSSPPVVLVPYATPTTRGLSVSLRWP